MLRLIALICLIAPAFVMDSCRTKGREPVIISGRFGAMMAKLEGKKLYLIDLSKKDLIRDSAIVESSTFRFSIARDSGFTPFRAKIVYSDTVKDANLIERMKLIPPYAYIRPLPILNPYDTNFVESSFFVADDPTDFSPVGNFSRELLIKGDRQNIPLYKHINLLVPAKDSTARSAQLSVNKNLIKRFPYSHYLLSQLNALKHDLSVNELRGLLTLFDRDLQADKRFAGYFALAREDSSSTQKQYASIRLKNVNGVSESLLDTRDKLTLVVFWASWCGPCRAEIPALKRLHATSAGKGFSIVSVSVDNNLDAWKNALSREQMPWRQLLVTEDVKSLIDFNFNVTQIPLSYLIDSNHRVVKKLIGQADSSFAAIKELLDQRIND